MGTMRIVQAAPLYGPLTENMTYGSIERVVVHSSEALMQRGHDVTVSALHGTSYRALPILASNEGDDAYAQQAQAVGSYTAELAHDAIHVHNAKSLGAILADGANARLFLTIHGPAERVVPKYRSFNTRNIGIFAVSNFHAATLRPHLPVRGVAHNGVDTAFYRPDNSPRGDYALVLGRVDPEKGVEEAIIAANDAGLKAIVAGPIHQQQYFQNQIQPHIRTGGAEYLGSVSDSQKLPLLQSARVLLQLSQFQEPCGMSALEAQACGIPVVASNAGALPETVRDGETGFIVPSAQQASHAISRIDTLRPERIRSFICAERSWAVVVEPLIEAYLSE